MALTQPAALGLRVGICGGLAFEGIVGSIFIYSSNVSRIYFFYIRVNLFCKKLA